MRSKPCAACAAGSIDVTLTLRTLAASDSIESLAALLHRTCARLGAMGLNFTAVDQPVEVTRRRTESGHCLVAELAGRVVGPVTVSRCYDINVQPGARATAWFYRQDVAHFHQLAVDPCAQGQRVGDQLVQACEAWALNHGLRAPGFRRWGLGALAR